MFNLNHKTMSKKVTEEERVRKEYSPRGQRSQKMVNFRCDLDNVDYLNTKPYKGRFLNDLIREHCEKNGGR